MPSIPKYTETVNTEDSKYFMAALCISTYKKQIHKIRCLYSDSEPQDTVVILTYVTLKRQQCMLSNSW